MKRARNSFPVPLCPEIRTDTSDGAIRSIMSRMALIAGLSKLGDVPSFIDVRMLLLWPFLDRPEGADKGSVFRTSPRLLASAFAQSLGNRTPGIRRSVQYPVS